MQIRLIMNVDVSNRRAEFSLLTGRLPQVAAFSLSFAFRRGRCALFRFHPHQMKRDAAAFLPPPPPLEPSSS
jgi:hypothetical protein